MREPRMIVWRNGVFGLEPERPLVNERRGIGLSEILALAALLAVSAAARAWGALTGQRIDWH